MAPGQGFFGTGAVTRPLAAAIAANAGLWLAAVPALAQTTAAMPNASAGGAAANSTQVETIIVTAQKRSENIQKVPEAITAATGAQLDQLHIVEPADLAYVAPALTFSVSTTPTSSGFSVRGIGTSTFSAGVEQSVSTVVDGVVFGQPQAASALIDIDHVEILEGPQGMLFGKNASAGLVSILTNDPRLGQFGGRIESTFGDDGEYRDWGVVNIPVNDTLAVRLLGFYNHANGVIEDVARPGFEKLNNVDNFGFRGKVLWTPTDKLKVLLSADYTRDDSACCFYTTRSDTAPNPAFPLNGIVQHYEQLYGIVPGPDNTRVALDQPLGETPGADLRVYAGASGKIDYSLGNFTITSITAYRDNHYLLDFDADQTPIDLFDRDGGPQSYRQFSEELRLTSPAGREFEYVAGLYYFSSEYDTHLIAGGPFLAPLGIPGTVIADSIANVSSRDYAAYAQGVYHVTPAFRLRVGGRVTHDDLSLFYSNYSDPASQLPLAFFGQTPATFTQSTSATNFSWRASAEYDFTPVVMGYVTVARGYKGPGFSALPGAVATQDQAVKPEIPMDYEGGIKSSLFDRRLVVNVSIFTEDFKDFQAQVYDANTVPPAFRVTNAGELKSEGAELQVTGKVTPDLTLAGNLAYVDAYYKNLQNISCYFSQTYPVVTAPCAVVGGNDVDNASGNRLANSPKYSWNLSADYRRPVFGGAWIADAETDYNWRSSVQFSANGDPNTIQAPYGLWNASLSFGPASQRWAVRAYVRNLLNQHFASFILPDAGDSKGGYAQFINREEFRHYGVVIDVNF
jgi:iron complex outermembrane receptor protein